MTIQDELQKKYKEIRSLSDEIPSELAKKIRINAEALLLIGRMHAATVYDYGKAYSDRKRAWGAAIVQTEGTQIVREGSAEIICAEFREIEAKAEAEMNTWKYAFIATQELIQAQKKELDTLMLDFKGTK